jgi:hypothetical protein
MHYLIAALTFSAVWAWAVAHQLAIGWVVAVGIDQLPVPQKPYGFYAWFFGVVQVLAANLNRGKRGVQGQLSAPPTKEL